MIHVGYPQGQRITQMGIIEQIAEQDLTWPIGR
jgi:hypothetical protein